MSYPANADVGGGSYNSSGTIGGGRVVDSNALPIDDVLNNTVQFSLSIKDAPDLDGASENSRIKDAYNKVKSEANESEQIKDEIIDRLEATNSKKYFTGEEAQNQINTLKEIIDDMNALCEALNGLAAYPLRETATKYNAALKKLKQCVDMKLLKDLADELNQAAKSKQFWRYDRNNLLKTEEKIVEAYGSLGVSDGEQSGGVKFVTIEPPVEIPPKREGESTKYKFVIKTWAYINYWKWFKLDFFPFNLGDDDLSKLVQKFNQVNINPYNYIGK